MTFAEESDFSQALGAVAVVASQIVVGVQIRQNARATKAAFYNAVSDPLNKSNRMFAVSAEQTRIWIAGMADRPARASEIAP